MYHMEFARWLQQALAARDMDQSEMARRATQAGYSIAPASISRIISGERDAGPDACIAIAAGLGIPREEVFRARGWLLREPELIVRPSATPRLVALARAADALDEDPQRRLLDAWEAMLVAVVGSPVRVRDTLAAAVAEITENYEELTPQEEVRRLLDLLKRIAPEAYEEYARRAPWAEGTEGSLGDEP